MVLILKKIISQYFSPTKVLIFLCYTVAEEAQVLKQESTWLRAGRQGFDPGCRRRGDFSSLLCIQTGPGVHLTFYKISTVAFPQE